MDFTTNYCGMYWSDGKLQSSVASGSKQPVSELDAACQQHDSEYANAENDGELNVADTKFYNNTSHLGLRGSLYGNLVYYGNKVLRFKPLSRMGNALNNSTRDGPEVLRRRAWLRGSNVSPFGGSSTASGDAVTMPSNTDTVYDPLPSNPSGDGAVSPIGGSSVYTSSGFVSNPDTPRPSPFTSRSLYKPLGRKRKRNKIAPRTQEEYYQLLCALTRSKS
jgi:hypothetical protein